MSMISVEDKYITWLQEFHPESVPTIRVLLNLEGDGSSVHLLINSAMPNAKCFISPDDNSNLPLDDSFLTLSCGSSYSTDCFQLPY